MYQAAQRSRKYASNRDHQTRPSRTVAIRWDQNTSTHDLTARSNAAAFGWHIQLGKVFDMTLLIAEVAAVYCAMYERRAIKTMLTVEE